MKCMLRNLYFLYKTTLAVKPLVRRYLQQTCLLRIQAISVPTKNRCNNRWGIQRSVWLETCHPKRCNARWWLWECVCSEILWFLYRMTNWWSTALEFNNVYAQKSTDFCTKHKCWGWWGQDVGSKKRQLYLDGRNGWCSCWAAKNNSELRNLVPWWRIMGGALWCPKSRTDGSYLCIFYVFLVSFVNIEFSWNQLY